MLINYYVKYNRVAALVKARLSRLLFCFLSIAKHFFANDPLRGFVQIPVEGGLDLQKFRPQGFLDERGWSAHDHSRVTLSRVTVGLKPVPAAQSGKEQPAPAIRQRELRFDRRFRPPGAIECGEDATACCRCGVSLSHRCSSLKESLYLAQLLAKFLFSSHVSPGGMPQVSAYDGCPSLAFKTWVYRLRKTWSSTFGLRETFEQSLRC